MGVRVSGLIETGPVADDGSESAAGLLDIPDTGHTILSSSSRGFGV